MPAHGAHHRGGGRGGGGAGRDGATKVYRRVTQTTTAAADSADAANGSSSKSNGAAHGERKVVVVLDSDAPPPPAFKSSLQRTLAQPLASTKTERESKSSGSARHGHGGRGAERNERVKSPRNAVPARNRSASPRKRSDRQQQHGASTSSSSRVVTTSATSSAATSSSPTKPADRKKQQQQRTGARTVTDDTDAVDAKPRAFVSSLASSLAKNDAVTTRSTDSQVTHDRHSSSGRGGSTHPSGRDARRQHQQHDRVVDDASSHSRLSEKNLAAHASATARPLRRKNSAESMSSIRSGYSERSDYSRSSRASSSRANSRWGDRDRDRDARYAGGSDHHRYDDSRHSMNNSTRGSGRYGHYGGASSSDAAAGSRLARSASDLTRRNAAAAAAATPSTQSQQQAQHAVMRTRSSQDVRFQKSATSSASGHHMQDVRSRQTSDVAHSTARGSTATQPTASVPFRSSLASTPTVSRMSAQDVRATKPSRSRSSSLARSVVSDIDAAPHDAVQLRSPGLDAARPTPTFVSSLARSSAIGNGESNEPSASSKAAELLLPPPATVDEAERKRLTSEALAKKFEARQAERERLRAATGGAAGAASDEQPGVKKSFQSGIVASEAATLTAPPPTSTVSATALSKDKDKAQRVQEHYNKIQQEDAMKEVARRANGFTSSLRSSIAPSVTRSIAPSFTPSTAPSVALPAAANRRATKTCYSLSDLRRLMPAVVAKPHDLPNMTIVEVTEFRPPTGRPIGGGGLRTGRPVPRERERASGRLAVRPERAVRSQAALPRHGSFAGDTGRGGSRRDGGRDTGRRRGGGGGGGGRGGYGPPPPPLYDGPIEPLTVSENRWVPKKDKSVVESTLSYVKGLLNKLTREKFAKITNEICAVELTSFELLRNLVSVIMDKALEEPSFADVYADLCKEVHTRTGTTQWPFVRAIESASTPGEFYWTVVREEDYQPMRGPFTSAAECVADASLETSAATETDTHVLLSQMTFVRAGAYTVAVAELSPGAFFYHKRAVDELSENEPVIGTFASADAALAAAQTLTSFKGLLVTRCQIEFEKLNKHSAAANDKPQEADKDVVDPRQKEILAIRAKRHMLGNIRFIGELFKVDILKQPVLQSCIFYLLGLELIRGAGSDFAAQTIRFPDEEDMEALCKMLSTAGKKFDQPKTRTVMNIIILRLVELSDDAKLPSRARFLIKDLLEMRDHMWEPRRAELQQKTLDEVRREAQKLQMQGKNAQHDDLSRRRKKTQITSAQLAKQSSNLLLHKVDAVVPEPAEAPEPAAPPSPTKDNRSSVGSSEPTELDAERHVDDNDDNDRVNTVGASAQAAGDDDDVSAYASRIKSIIQEYTSIVDLDEAAACVRELPTGACHNEFAAQTVNLALDGNARGREHAVNLLVGLYERGALTAVAIQHALLAVAECLDDLRIDIPLVHEYAALLLGRLIAAGCFGISWMLDHALALAVESRLAANVFVDVLAVLELESDVRSVKRMLVDEEIDVARVLPVAMRDDVHAFLVEHGIEDFFADGDDDDVDCDDVDSSSDALDPGVAAKMRATLDEFLVVNDVDELVACVNELASVCANRWSHFVQLAVEYSVDSKPSVRSAVAALLEQLVGASHIVADDLEVAIEAVFAQYEDLRVDIPTLGANVSDVYAALVLRDVLTLDWLRDATRDLVATGYAAELVSALLHALSERIGEPELRMWWRKQQSNSDTPTTTLWSALLDGVAIDSTPYRDLVKWQHALTGADATPSVSK